MVFDSTRETVAQRIYTLLLCIGDDLQSHQVVLQEGLKKTVLRVGLVDVTFWA